MNKTVWWYCDACDWNGTVTFDLSILDEKRAVAYIIDQHKAQQCIAITLEEAQAAALRAQASEANQN